MIKLAPSILAADFSRLGEQVVEADRAGAQYIHIDVMDGDFVPNISFGAPVMKCIRPLTDKVFDVHLMVEEPGRYISDFVEAGADLIVVHAEACRHLHRTVEQIHQAGVRAGVALNPATPLCVVEEILPELDMVLLMSVNPGFGGQKYIPSVTDKIRRLRTVIEERGLSVDIEVDGGVTIDNVEEVIGAGANIIVAGSAVFGGSVSDHVEKFLEVFKNNE
ncbi:MAG TPA: ribulose-phosphate 3-epimerase [Candidatus Onthocola gallistercoris]|uniref:Ribulose-phosphate 3-epimerase n=1 Tax=Candidatus Onthocola gallistercoris TaxID=2840876 RepID=A0A9D1KWC0_9FIRM|nr:ribulose-phosphate 3-epimerase [Candidatus Onthocola gallistercoris]